MNNLTHEKRHHLKIAVILIVIVFVVIYGTIMLMKYTHQKPTTKNDTEKGQVIFKQSNLQFFNYSMQINAYPDRIAIHYPYLLVIRPDQFSSEIYNMETKRKEKELSEILLDYFNGDIVYNKQGYRTYFNNKDLGLICDQAFIKDKTEILCITRPDHNKQQNKMIVINSQTLQKKDVYTSQNVLTAVYFEKNVLYIGEYDFIQNNAFVTVNNKTAQAEDLVNIFYPMGNNMYSASLKSKRNNMNESYSEIISNNKYIESKLINKGEIILHQ